MSRLLRLIVLLCWALPGVVMAQGAYIAGPRTIAGWLNTCLTTGASNAFLCALPYALPGYVDKQCFVFRANHSITGPATLNVDNKGAKVLKKWQAGVLVDVAPPDIVTGQYVSACYDTVTMQVLSLGSGASEGGGGGSTGDMTAVGDIPSGDAGTPTAPLGALWFTQSAAPSPPASGQGQLWLESATGNLGFMPTNGIPKFMVQPVGFVPHEFVTALSPDGSASTARPSRATLSDGNTLITLDESQTLRNKQVVDRVCQFPAATGNLTPNIDLCDVVYRHDVVGAVSIQTPSATGDNPRPMQALVVSFAAATDQAVTWSSAYAGGYGLALPGTIPGGKYTALAFRYNPDSTKYELWSGHLPDASLTRLQFQGSTDGLVTMQPQASAGTYNWNLPTTAGGPGTVLTSGGGAAAPMTWTAATSATAVNTLVLRDGSGNFSAGTMTGALAGNATTATALQVTQRFISLECVPDDSPLTTGDGQCYFPLPPTVNGWRAVGVHGHLGAAVSAAGAVTVALDICGAVATGIRCSGTNRDLLSTTLTIDQGEDGTETAAVAAVVNAAADDLATGEWIRVNLDSVGVGAQGLYLTVVIQTP